MKEELVKICSYKLNRDIIDKCVEEEREITKEDVEIHIHQILKGNNIKYKNKLNEVWTRTGKYAIYNLEVEIYVNKEDELKSKELIKEYLK